MRGWFDRFFRGEDEGEEYEERPEETGSSPLSLEPPVLRDRPPTPPATETPRTASLDAPIPLSASSAPLDSPMEAPIPAYEAPAPSAVRAVGEWSGGEVVSLLNELPPAPRERVAEALLLWHDAESQLAQSARRSQAIAEQSEHLLTTSLSDPEFSGEADRLRQGTQMQRAALDTLLAGNRARAREWVLNAVQSLRNWPPTKVMRLFEQTGIGPMTLQDILPRLRSMDAGPRLWAAEALGVMRDTEGDQALLTLLRDPDAEVRAAAVEALGRKSDPSLLHALSGVIKRDPDWHVRLRAINAAQSVEGYEAIGFLHELLRDTGWWRELQVLNSVDRTDPTRPTPPMETPVGTYEKVREGVVNSLLAKVQALLPSSDPAHRAWLMEVLGDTGDTRAVPLLSSALHDAELEVRLRAIRGLGRIGGPTIVDLITPSLKDQQAEVRIQAAEALGDANDFRAVEPLLEALRDPSEYVRAAVTVAVGKIVDTRALKPLIAALNDPDKDVRDQTQLALQRMSDPRTMNLISSMLEAGGLRKRPPGS